MASRKIKLTTSASVGHVDGAFLIGETNVEYDHHLLIGEIRLRIAGIHRQEEKIGCRLKTRRLEDAEVKRPFIEELENRAANIPEGDMMSRRLLYECYDSRERHLWTAIERPG